jgi:hypothetical protein
VPDQSEFSAATAVTKLFPKIGEDFEWRSIGLTPSARTTKLSVFGRSFCYSDTEAAVWAKQIVDDHAIEIWSGERFVVMLKAKKE